VHVYLYGAPGGGKTTAAKLIAAALKTPLYALALNAATPEYRLTGYLDATGTYRTTGFRRGYENGGLVLLDEIDNASGNLLTSLNTALENGFLEFPDGTVLAHPEFHLIATGNTPDMALVPCILIGAHWTRQHAIGSRSSLGIMTPCWKRL